MAADRKLDPPRLVTRRSARESEVDALDTVFPELFGESQMSPVVLRRDQHARGSAIQTVHDAGPKHATDPGEIPAVMKQGVHEGPTLVTGSRMNDHMCGFVNDDQ
jgi:hypothetical protein